METFQKAFTEALSRTWQDRSTYFSRVLFPLLLLLAVIYVSLYIGLNQEEKSKIKLGIVGGSLDTILVQKIKDQANLQVFEFTDGIDIPSLILADSLQLGLSFEEGFGERLAQGRNGAVQLHYHSQRSHKERTQVVQIINRYRDRILAKRLNIAQLSEEFIYPIDLSEEDVYRWMDDLPKYLGAVLPFFLVLFGFLACIYPSFDLFGDLHSADAEKMSSTVAKWLLTVFIGLFTAILTALGLFLLVKFHPSVPIFFKNLILSWFTLKSLSLMLLALLPLLLFFVVWLSLIRRVAATYKRAQNVIQASKVFFIMAFALVFLPFISLDSSFLYLPGTNVSLFGRSVILGEWEWGKLGMIWGVLVGYSVVGMGVRRGVSNKKF